MQWALGSVKVMDSKLEEERNRMEDESRRQDSKRKEKPGGRKPKRRKLEKLVGWGDQQDETNDGGLSFEVVPGLGVGNMPNNPNTIIDHGFGLEVGNSFGVSSADTDKGVDVEQRLDIEIEKQLKKPSKDGN